MFDIFQTGDQRNAANAQIAGINQGYGDLSNQYGQGRGAIDANYAQALAPFSSNFNTAQGGLNAYAGGAGVGGGQGVTDALKAFANSPGYQFTLDQGNQNILRNQAATGQLNSGGTNVDLLKFGQGLAGTQFQNYMQNLLPFLSLANSSAGGIANVKTGQGNALNQSFTGQGNAAAGADIARGNANAQAAMAPYNASANLWGVGLGALNDVTQLFGGKSGGGSGSGNWNPFAFKVPG